MSAKTKIIVLRMKELIYTALFVGLVLFLILLFFFMLGKVVNSAFVPILVFLTKDLTSSK